MVYLPGSVPPGRASPQIPESWSSAGSAAMFPFLRAHRIPTIPVYIAPGGVPDQWEVCQAWGR